MAPVITELEGLLAPAGIDLLAVVDVARYDERAPPALASAVLCPGSRSVIVVGSGGRGLWTGFRRWLAADLAGRLVAEAHPLDRYVRGLLDEGGRLLATAGVAARCFEPTLSFLPRLDFRRLGELAGLGSPSPLGLIVHPRHGPYWALRGAWFVDAALPPTPAAGRPCDGCPQPCRAEIPAGAEGTLQAATVAARLACPLQESRYTDEQLEYHHSTDGRSCLLGRLSAGG